MHSAAADCEEVFPSKIDRWLLVVVIGALASSPVIAVAAMMTDPKTTPAITAVVVGILALLIGFVAWVFASTRYLVGDEVLTIRSGPFRWRIVLEEIEEVRPSHNPLSSPALSLDRLEVRYGRVGWLLISPRDRAGFLVALAARTKGLVAEGERAYRRAGREG